jgi:hypothetical protein
MAETIRCPDCDRTVSVPERLFGKRVRCPSCKAIFTAESPVVDVEVVEDEAPPRPPTRKPAQRTGEADDHDRPRRPQRGDEDEDRPRRALRRDREEKDDDEDRPRRRRRDLDDEDDEERPRHKPLKLSGDEKWAWRRVRFGLLIVLAAAVIALLANIGGVIAFRSSENIFAPRALAGGGEATGLPSLATATIVVLILYYLTCICAVGLAIAGNIYCMAIPHQRSARSTITSSIAMLCLALFLLLGAWLYLWVRVQIWEHQVGSSADAKPGPPPLEGILVYLFGGTVLLAQPAVFSLFLRNVAQGIRHNGLALNMIFQAIVPALIALGFLVAGMSIYSSITAELGARFEGTSRVYAQEAAEGAWTALKVLYFVAIAYGVWFIGSSILTCVAIIRYVEGR